MFYCFDQNNSGGNFTVNNDVAQFVIIEAASAQEANERAESIDIYFDGVDDGIDCRCCGDRWYPACEYDGKEEPEIYGKDPSEYHPILTGQGEVYCYVHFLNDIVQEYRRDDGTDARLTS